MSQLVRAEGTNAVYLVDATSGNETVSLTQLAAGRMVKVRRKDSSANTVTVTVTTGLTLDGVANGSTTVRGDTEVQFFAVDAGWESLTSGGGMSPVTAKRPTSGTSTPIIQAIDETDAPRFTDAIIPGAATQTHIIGKAGEPAILGLLGDQAATTYADFTHVPGTGNTEIDVLGGDLALRPLSPGKNVTIWSIAGGNPKLRVGSQGFTAALDLQHDGANAHVSCTSGYVGFQGDKVRIAQTGSLDYTGPTATSAGAGANGAPPAQVAGYLVWSVGGTTVKVPYYLA